MYDDRSKNSPNKTSMNCGYTLPTSMATHEREKAEAGYSATRRSPCSINFSPSVSMKKGRVGAEASARMSRAILRAWAPSWEIWDTFLFKVILRGRRRVDFVLALARRGWREDLRSCKREQTPWEISWARE